MATFTATDPEGGAVGWSLSGDDADDFSVNSAGELSFATVPDINDPTDADEDNIYNVTVNAAAGAGNTSEHPVEVTIFGIAGPAALTADEGRTPSVGIYRLVNPPRSLRLDGNSRDEWRTAGADSGRLKAISCRDFADGCPGENPLTSGVLFYAQGFAPSFASPGDAGRDNTYNVNVRIGPHTGGVHQGFGTLDVALKIHDLGGVTTIGGRAQHTVGDGFRTGFTYQVSPVQGRTLTVALGGPDADAFYFSNRFSTNWELNFKNGPDHDNPTDQGGTTSTR